MDKTSLKRAFRALEEAFQEGDLEAFLDAHDLDGESGCFLPDFGRRMSAEEVAQFFRFFMGLPGPGWIVPRDLSYVLLGDVGLVTYGFSGGEDGLGRGTRVFRWDGQAWKCVHFHLSTAPDLPLPHEERPGDAPS